MRLDFHALLQQKEILGCCAKNLWESQKRFFATNKEKKYPHFSMLLAFFLPKEAAAMAGIFAFLPRKNVATATQCLWHSTLPSAALQRQTSELLLSKSQLGIFALKRKSRRQQPRPLQQQSGAIFKVSLESRKFFEAFKSHRSLMDYFARTEIVEIYRQKLVRSVNRVCYLFVQYLIPILFVLSTNMRCFNAKKQYSMFHVKLKGFFSKYHAFCRQNMVQARGYQTIADYVQIAVIRTSHTMH